MRPASFLGLGLTFAFCSISEAQISIVNTGAGSNAVNFTGAYVQSFNGLTNAGTNTWTDNSTVPGWYAAYGTNDPTNSFGSLIAAAPMYRTNFTNTVLYSVPQHFDNNSTNSTYRALGFNPSGGTNGHAGLRMVNNTGSTITGFTITYEIRWGYSQDDGVDSFDVIAGGSGYTSLPIVNVTASPLGGANNAAGSATTNSGGNINGITKTASGAGYTNVPDVTFTGGGGSNALARAIMKLITSSNSVTLSAKTFAAGVGSISNVGTGGWTPLNSVTNKNTTSSSVPDNWNYVTQTLTNLNLAPGQEIWLDWQFKKEGSTSASLAALDNVRIYDFAKNDPAILTQPVAQSVILSNAVTFSVVASSGSTLSYQWRKNGSNITGATGSSYSIASVLPSDVGNYDVVVSAGGNSVSSTAVPLQVYTRMPVKGPVANASAVTAPNATYTQDATLADITVINTANYTNKFDLYLPDTTVKANSRPAIVVIHGGGGNDGDKQDTREVQACIEFASHGYVALSLNYKKSFKTTSSGTWSTAWPQNIKDAKTAVRWLRKSAATYGIDTNRIGAIGFSWGGNEAAMLALTDGDAALDPASEDGLGVYSTKVACAANFYGAVQIPDYHNMNQFSGNGVPGSTGTMDSPTNNYLSASPASRATSSAAPMLLSHGDADLEVMPSQNFALKAALLNAGAKVQGVQMVPGGLHSYYLYDNGSHNTNTNQITDVRASTFGFFDQYLMPYAPAITSPSTIAGAAGTSFTHQIQANNTPTLFSATGLPAGVSLDANTGILSGTLPTGIGTITITITATGPNGTASRTLSLVSSDAITVSTTVEGTTPALLGYNLGHFMTSGDAADWFRYAGVKAARVFISASDLQGTTSPGRKLVTSNSLTSFNSAVASARSGGTNSSTYIKWSDYNYNYNSTAGNNDINYANAFSALTGLGVDLLVNITCSPTTFPLASSTDYQGWWEIWQHYYAQAYLLSRDYGIRRFSMFNEPNNWSGMTEPDWMLRLRICSDAIQTGVADMNAKHGRNVIPVIYAPNTANGESKYNSGADTWGRDAVTNRHLKLDGTTDSSFLLMHFYNYQKYSMYTDDTGSLTGYSQDIDLLRGYITGDMAGETPFPLVLSEFNVRTGSSYDGTSNTQDSPDDYVALGANCIALTRRAANQLFLFKFGQTEDTTSPYGVAKNGTHYVDNLNSSCNYGGATKAAEAYRLFNKAATGGRSYYTATASSGVAMSSSSGGSGLWRLVTRDPTSGNYYVYLANKKSSSLSFSLNLAAWSIPDGTPVVVEEVSSTCSGGVTQVVNVKNGQAYLGGMPAQSVWLVTVPNQAASLAATTASEDTQVGDGINVGSTGGNLTALQARADGTADGRRATLIKIPVPSGSSNSWKSIVLDVGAAAITGSNNLTQAHVYGLTSDNWSESSSTWSSLGSFLKQGTAAGNQIPQNVALNTGTNPVAKMLGQILVNSTSNNRKMLDVTDFVKSRTNGVASFLIVQEHRWNYSADLTDVRTTGDIQNSGLSIVSKEVSGAGPRLLAVQTASVSNPPVIFAQPQPQSINLGSSITLAVTTDGSTGVSYQWKKDGVALVGATGPDLVILAAGLADAGNYICDVTNLYGTSTSASASVAVSAAPVVATALKPASVYVGDTVTLSASFTGAPAPTYSWTRNGVTIAGATDSSYTFIPSATSESGTYAVIAANIYGTATSSASVTVNALPTSFKNISSSTFTYLQNFDGIEKSSSYNLRGTTYATWTDGGPNGSNTNMEGWSCTLDQGFLGYRSLNNSSSSNLSSPPPESQSGLLSMGSASGDSDRALGGLPWTNNKVYMGLRLKNSTGKILNGCTVSYVIEQYSATVSAKNSTTLTLATQINATSLKTGIWNVQSTYTPLNTNPTSYVNLNGASSSNRTTNTLTLSNLNVGTNQDLWLRWTVATTSTEPIAIGIDNVSINALQVTNIPQSITFSLSKNSLTFGDSAPLATVSATSGLPVTLTSSSNSVIAVGSDNVLSVVGAGTTVLTANQPGDSTWAAADPVQLVVTVNKASQSIAFGLSSSTAKVGDSSKILIATSDADLPVTLSSSDSSVASISGYTLTIVGPGTATITATQPGNANYLAALPVTQTLTVASSGPTFASTFSGASPMAVGSDGMSFLLKYAFGGTNSNSPANWPIAAYSNNELSLTYLARTNDTNLSIYPERCTDLSASNSWTNTGISVSTLGTTNVDGTTVERRKASVISTNVTRQFLRIKVTSGP